MSLAAPSAAAIARTTGIPLTKAFATLSGDASAFDVVIGGEDVSEHEPHPEGLQRALAQLRTEPQDAWYVGDHPVDAQAAASAQLHFVAVLTGVTTREGFAAYRVHHFLESMEPLPALIVAALRPK